MKPMRADCGAHAAIPLSVQLAFSRKRHLAFLGGSQGNRTGNDETKHKYEHMYD